MAILNGSSANEVLEGTSDEDHIRGRDGHDILIGRSGYDAIWGGSGTDFLIGNQYGDGLDGGRDRDILWGGNGNDVVIGGKGQDVIYGGAGDDILVGGGSMADFSYGRTSYDAARDGVRDTFVFSSDQPGRDTIKDFERGIDEIDLTAFSGVNSIDDLEARSDNGDLALTVPGEGVTIVFEGLQATTATVADLATDILFHG